MQAQSISMDQLVGEEAWICNKSNPALEHLVSVLVSNKLEWKSNSLKRIESILASQHMLVSNGVPTRYLWFSGLAFDDADDAGDDDDDDDDSSASFTKRDFLSAIEQYVMPKRVFIPGRSRGLPLPLLPLSFALVELKSIRDALFIFMTFQHKKTFAAVNRNHKKSRMLLGFARRLIFDRVFLSNTVMGGFLNIFAGHKYFSQTFQQKKWQLCWCFFQEFDLICYNDLQCEQAAFVVHFENSLICDRSQYSVEVIDRNNNVSYFIYSHSKHQMQIWRRLFQARRGSRDTGAASDEVLLACHMCQERKPLNEMLSPDVSSHFSCIPCLRQDILRHLNGNGNSNGNGEACASPSMVYLSAQYSIQDLMELLDSAELSKYLDLKLDELLQSGANFIHCPHCRSTWEFVMGNVQFDSPDFSRELGVNNKLLGNDSQMHYLQHRVCCRSCNKSFCRSCSIMPYHSGFDCDLYQTYLHAKKCRFCATALMPGEIAPELSGGTPPALRNVCNSDCCLAKRKLSCGKMLDCGHECFGAFAEAHCMSCIRAECVGRKPYVTQLPDDYCNICFTEELDEAPCIELDCGHIFHYECIQRRLESGNDEAAVNFAFVKCPLCSMFIGHCNLFSDELRRVQCLYRDLEMRAYRQLKEDEPPMPMPMPMAIAIARDDADDADDSDDSDAMASDAVGYAMKRYAFYNCHICKKPYYGGLANCRDIAQGLHASDFVCPACSGIGMDSCQIHGRDYMLYKCKFCCSVATYFCWGTTHFCINCHRKQENHDFMTTKSRSDLAQCPDANACPLKVEHPPNGEEFSLGCSLCRGSDNFVTHQTNPPQKKDNSSSGSGSGSDSDSANDSANDSGNGSANLKKVPSDINDE
jgi:E3 ubiquitin-protein ligase MYCBP2